MTKILYRPYVWDTQSKRYVFLPGIVRYHYTDAIQAKTEDEAEWAKYRPHLDYSDFYIASQRVTRSEWKAVDGELMEGFTYTPTTIPCWEPVNLEAIKEITNTLKEWLRESNQVGFATRYDATAFCMGYYGGLGYNQYEAINQLFVEGELQA